MDIVPQALSFGCKGPIASYCAEPKGRRTPTRLQPKGISAALAAGIVVAILAVAGAAYLFLASTGSGGTSLGTSSSSQNSTISLSTSFPVFIGFQQDLATLLATPYTTLNYTVLITRFNNAANEVRLSASSPVPGVHLILNPTRFTFLGGQEAITLGISVDSSVNSLTLPIRIVASTAVGVTNTSFKFQLDKGLIMVLGLELRPVNLHVGVGQTVTWMNLVPPLDEGQGAPIVIKFVNGSAVSPSIQRNERWSQTFHDPGTYVYDAYLFGFPQFRGTVVVA